MARPAGAGTGAKWCVLSPAYLAGTLGQFTDVLAQSYGLETATWPVIPLILRPVKLPPRLAMLTALDATDPQGWEHAIETLLRDLRRPPPPPPERPACPYQGMVSFDEGDSKRFFGRSEEVQKLLNQLRLHPFLTVIGPSGSGKSSLVFAGLIPALRSSSLFGPGGWLVRILRPGDAPGEALALALGGDPDKPTHTATLLLAAQPDTRHLLLVVDQFEELFTRLARPTGRTRCSGHDTKAFQQALLGLAATPGCYVLLTVRADFYSDLMASLLWPEIQAHRAEVLPLGEAGLRQAIVRPAEDAGVFVETALVERLVADAAGEPGILPFVQETLVLLWEKVERCYLPLAAYEALTGLQVAMADRAEAALGSLGEEERGIARRIFLRLIQFGEGRADTRRQQPVSALAATGDVPTAFDKTLCHLAAQRLLTLSGEAEHVERTVDIAHEALIEGWPTLRRWLGERREVEQARRRLEAKAKEWVRLGQGEGGLLDEVELLEAERWLPSADAAGLGRDAVVLAVIEASRAAIQEADRKLEASRQHELEQARVLTEVERQRAEVQASSARRLLRLAAALVVVFLVAVGAAFYAIAQQREAQAGAEDLAAEVVRRSTTEAKALENEGLAATRAAEAVTAQETASAMASDLRLRQLLLKSESLVTDRYDQALLLSIATYRLADTVETRNNLLQVFRARPQLIRYIPISDTSSVIAFSPDSKTLMALTQNGIRFWEAGTGVAVEPVSMMINGSRVASRDGTTGFSALRNTILLWDLTSKPQPRFLSGQQTDDISPDGKIKASLRGRGVALQDAETDELIGTLEDPYFMDGYMLTFSPDSQRLVVASHYGGEVTDEVVLTWELRELLEYYWENREAEGVREAGEFWIEGDEYSQWVKVENFVFSSDGRDLAVTARKSADVHYVGETELWQGEPALTSLTSECDGDFAVGREDGTVVFGRDFRTQKQSMTPSPSPFHHPGPVRALVLSSDCHRMASMGGGVLVLWDLTVTTGPTTLGPISTPIVTRDAVDPDASLAGWDDSGAVAGSECRNRASTAYGDDSTCVQSAIAGGYAGFTGIVTSLEKSPDGKILAARHLQQIRHQPECSTGEM